MKQLLWNYPNNDTNNYWQFSILPIIYIGQLLILQKLLTNAAFENIKYRWWFRLNEKYHYVFWYIVIFSIVFYYKFIYIYITYNSNLITNRINRYISKFNFKTLNYHTKIYVIWNFMYYLQHNISILSTNCYMSILSIHNVVNTTICQFSK